MVFWLLIFERIVKVGPDNYREQGAVGRNALIANCILLIANLRFVE